MTQKAQVQSIEALADFRNTLVAFKAEIDNIIDEILMEIARTRQWLETDQRDKWEGIASRRTRELANARQELLSSRMSNLRSEMEARKAVNKAKLALEDAQAKLTRIKSWSIQFPRQVELLVKPINNLSDTIAHKIPRALAFLSEIIGTLNEYANIATPQPNPLTQQPAPTDAPTLPAEQPL